MKKLLLSLLIAALIVPCTIYAQNSGKCGDNLQWSYNRTTHALTITGSGEMTEYDYYKLAPWHLYRSEITSVSIPNSVTSIGSSAFSGCTGLTSVTIPNSVTSIGESAFSVVPNIVYNGTATGSPWGARSVNGYVDGYLVYSDASKTQLLACSSAATGSINIPNNVTSIGGGAFSCCTGLTSVTIPNSVTCIKVNTFENCMGLQNVTIPYRVFSIGDGAFENCKNLENIYCYCTTPPATCYGENYEHYIYVRHRMAAEVADCYCENYEYYTYDNPHNPFREVNRDCYLHVPAESLNDYKTADIWRDFRITAISAENIETTIVHVTPHTDNVDVVWPTVNNATTYEMTITSGGNTICTLIFNSQGQLTNITFRAPALRANGSNSGFSFNVTGLENGNTYSLVIKAKDSNGTVLQTFSQTFTTGTTAIENVTTDGANAKLVKLIEDGRVIILMPDGRKYDASGRLMR